MPHPLTLFLVNVEHRRRQRLNAMKITNLVLHSFSRSGQRTIALSKMLPILSNFDNFQLQALLSHELGELE